MDRWFTVTISWRALAHREFVTPSHRERPKDSLEAATQPGCEHRPWLIVFLPVNCASLRDAVDGIRIIERTEVVNSGVDVVLVALASSLARGRYRGDTIR
jgi:hypothetical protein